ncbi:MAG: PD-(D/E)XK nuclease family protein, partial [Oscillospiraceae bacterium]|nr:PD-(D/E)XK nuclease family protein [Oscillospiraceae bacterium]
ELGQRISRSSNLHRECKFSVLTPSRELLALGTEERILLQGVVDCWLEEEDRLVVIDFKTDHITESNYEAKRRDYALQLRLYSSALERMTGKTVQDAIVYFFSLNRGISVLND